MKKIEIFWLTIFTIIILGFASYPIITPRDVLVKEDIEYLYYKEYKWWGLDSCVYKYHKPIIHHGEVINKYTRRHFVGLVGKGGHSVTRYHVVFKFDNRTEDEDCIRTYYHNFNIGDNVEVTEKFYPWYELTYKKLK